MDVQLPASPPEPRLNTLSVSFIILLVIAIAGAVFQWKIGLTMSIILLTTTIWFTVAALVLLLRYRSGIAGLQLATAEIAVFTTILIGVLAIDPVKSGRLRGITAEPRRPAASDTMRKPFEIRQLDAATTDALRVARVHARHGQTALVTEVVQDQLSAMSAFRGDAAVDMLIAKLEQCRRDAAARVPNACPP